ncbi:trehalose synthase [Nocardioides gansuensis]|uniref:Trehalose synthase n=1 Tax=Nocardioides gansuensis TaxID=2138300 RepID=A0A2T8FER9_9ACTN|nr:alpha-amylase family protein [Nocardioides gansuensis]PVG84204.1 trehalose synthase [Nocardioides gansuensis]
MNLTDTADLWWKTAVIYCADVQTFLDLDRDGHGDLRGMQHRVDYLAELGITCLWLMPFYPTTDKDDGYDVTDFYGVDPRVGSAGDFVELVHTCRSRGIRVIVDLVMNHTSERHPWFVEARKSPDNPMRHWYVWRGSTPPDTSKQVVFPDVEDSIWELDERTGEYYLHNFYKTQPDLNLANPEVRDEVVRTMGYWLQLGVSGFRVDAIPFMFQVDQLPKRERRFPDFDTHAYLRSLRSQSGRRVGDSILLGENNLPYEEQRQFFGGGDGDELTVQFDFIGMQATWLSLARGDCRPLADALRQRPPVDPSSQWGNFLRNHDELTLDKLSKQERHEVFDAFGPDPEMQIFDRGLRRRLPTMLGGDQRRIRMAYSLMFSLPGTPVLFYGEEIGMGENLDIPGRNAVRSPMQWSPGPHGGFTTSDRRRLRRPAVTGMWGPEHVNVSDQRNDPDSLLSFIKLLVNRYRQSPEIGWSGVEVLDHSDPRVLVHVLRKDEWAMVALHNFGDEPVEVSVPVPGVPRGTSLVDLLSPGVPDRTTAGASGRLDLTLPPYGYAWWRVLHDGEVRLA